MSGLYNKIVALCEDRGITVTGLCRRCDVSRASLYRPAPLLCE